jgi:hypothetical protein
MFLNRSCPHCGEKSLPLVSFRSLAGEEEFCPACEKAVKRKMSRLHFLFSISPFLIYFVYSRSFERVFISELSILWLSACLSIAIALYGGKLIKS